MSRRNEAQKDLNYYAGMEDDTADYYQRKLVITLADEVDAKDAIIDKLLAMLADEVLTVSDEERGIFISIKTPLLHARACEIAGRKS